MFYTDHGSDFTSHHLEQVSADLKMGLVFSQAGMPRGRGRIERFFRTINQMPLCGLPGYTPAQVARDIDQLCRGLHAIQWEQIDREERARVDAVLKHEKDKQDQYLLDKGWPSDRLPPGPRALGPFYEQVTEGYYHRRKALPDPTTLVVIDEADRLKMTTLEQVRAIFDQGGIGLVLIGMPGIEKRLSRYPQLYSRVGFVHAFRPLSAAEVRGLLQHKWLPFGVTLPEDGIADEEAVAAIIRITGGNFRLLHRLITQIARIMEINALPMVTCQVVEAARESLVIGTVC